MSKKNPGKIDWKSILQVHACGREWSMERTADMETLWNAMTIYNNEDERIPYWVELWPSSLVLADWLGTQKNRIAGQPCLDLGCGIGLTALVGQWLGAHVIGMDYEPEALHYARKNAVRNHVSQPDWVVMDWRRPAIRQRSLRFIWGGDIMYEQRFAVPVVDFLTHALAEDGLVWFAEPSRPIYNTFRTTLVNRGWNINCVAKQSIPALYPQSNPVPVRIWEIQP